MEWGLLGATSLVWGSSYLWIAIGLDAFQPGLIAWLRLAFGAAVLVLLPRPKIRIVRTDWSVIVLIALAGNAGPALLFAMAEQTLESSVVGMLTAATPLATLAVALPLGNRSLRPVHGIGLGLGLIGVLAMSIDNVAGASTGVAGIIYVLTAIVGYAVVSNVIGPLVERYGAVGVVVRAQVIALAAMTPTGYLALGDSTFLWRSFIAVAILGIFGTGIARSLQASLISRAGAPRASVVGYLVPVVAAVLGVVVLDEVLSPVELIGLAIISIGAFLGSRQIKQSG
jgi:drug/metabolite transporter (DMT)-like permease